MPETVDSPIKASTALANPTKLNLYQTETQSNTISWGIQKGVLSESNRRMFEENQCTIKIPIYQSLD